MPPTTFTSSMPRPQSKHLWNKTLILPNWDPVTSHLIVANLQRAGIDARSLDETPSSIQRSLRYNTGQCIPLNIIAQEFMDYVETHDLDPAQTVLWMGEGRIACNIKLYPNFIQSLLKSYGNNMDRAGIFHGEMTRIFTANAKRLEAL